MTASRSVYDWFPGGPSGQILHLFDPALDAGGKLECPEKNLEKRVWTISTGSRDGTQDSLVQSEERYTALTCLQFFKPQFRCSVPDIPTQTKVECLPLAISLSSTTWGYCDTLMTVVYTNTTHWQKCCSTNTADPWPLTYLSVQYNLCCRNPLLLVH